MPTAWCSQRLTSGNSPALEHLPARLNPPPLRSCVSAARADNAQLCQDQAPVLQLARCQAVGEDGGYLACSPLSYTPGGRPCCFLWLQKTSNTPRGRLAVSLNFRTRGTRQTLPDSPSLLVRVLARGTSLAVQWLRLRLPTPGGAGSIPGGGAKIPGKRNRT